MKKKAKVVKVVRYRAPTVAQMRARQEAFDALSPAEKRVEIAKDALKQLRLKRLVASRGTYVTLLGRSRPANRTTQVCEVTRGMKCNVCALGALMVAGVELGDRVQVGDQYPWWVSGRSLSGIGGDDSRKYLSQFFEAEQLRVIECVFENWNHDGHGPELQHVHSSSRRMAIILRNIIANKGEFRVDLLPKAKR